MTLLRRTRLGKTGLDVSSVTVGAAAWKSHDEGPTSGAEDTFQLAHAVLAHPVLNSLDTANSYGTGQSERRIGVALDSFGGLPERFILSTKADRDMQTGEFTGERMIRSLEESLARLGIDRFPLLFLHDPENVPWGRATSARGPLAALIAARNSGLIGCLGISGGPSALLADFLRLNEFDALMTHNRYTLLDRSADALLDLATERGVGVFNAAPYGGGILTSFPLQTTRYAYGEAGSAMLFAAESFGAIARDAEVPLAAIALQFSLRDPRIHSTVVGMRSLDDLTATEELAGIPIPEGVWTSVNKVALDVTTWQDHRPGSDPRARWTTTKGQQ